jgi:hypothetical protein
LERIAELHDGAMDALHQSNPVELMQRRADRLMQRGADLKKLADAWEPLYKTLSEDQKKRMAFASYVVMRGMRDVIAHSSETEDDDDQRQVVVTASLVPDDALPRRGGLGRLTSFLLNPSRLRPARVLLFVLFKDATCSGHLRD